MERWIKKYNALNGSLRGLGQIGHWGQGLKQDLQEISENLEEIVDFKKAQAEKRMSQDNEPTNDQDEPQMR